MFSTAIPQLIWNVWNLVDKDLVWWTAKYDQNSDRLQDTMTHNKIKRHNSFHKNKTLKSEKELEVDQLLYERLKLCLSIRLTPFSPAFNIQTKYKDGCLRQDLSTLVLLLFGAGWFHVVVAALSILGCWITSWSYPLDTSSNFPIQ
jgi:hypothetical protein